MGTNRGSEVEHTPWTEREVLLIHDCVIGLRDKDQMLYSRGWLGLEEVPVMRTIGGLSLAIGTLRIYLAKVGEWPTEPEKMDEYLQSLVQLVPERAGMPAEQLEEVIEWCLNINDEDTWESMRSLGFEEALSRILIAYTMVAIRGADIEGINLTDAITGHLEALGAPKPTTIVDLVDGS